MHTQTYLIFELNGLQYGLETTYVREVFQLPELTPVADTPGDMIGLLNLRGKILPVIHLAKRLSHEHLNCQISDRIIVVEYQGFQVGMVVNHVNEVRSIPASWMEAAPSYEFRNHTHVAFAAGVAKIGDDLVMLLNAETLIRQPDDVALTTWEATLDVLDTAPVLTEDTPYPKEQIFEVQPTSILTSFFSLYCPQATAEERNIFQQRAKILKDVLENSDISQLTALAVFQLGEEYFGVNLQTIREFIEVRHIVPIPGCPAHVVGNMNLRGEVMTLIDIRSALNLTQANTHHAKAVIVEVDDIVFGIVVEQVLDVVYLSSTEIAPMPMAIAKHCQHLFQGLTPYHEKNMSILNLSNVLTQESLMVEQVA